MKKHTKMVERRRELLRKIKSLQQDGQTYEQIAASLNAAGVRRHKGGEFNRHDVAAHIKNCKKSGIWIKPSAMKGKSSAENTAQEPRGRALGLNDDASKLLLDLMTVDYLDQNTKRKILRDFSFHLL